MIADQNALKSRKNFISKLLLMQSCCNDNAGITAASSYLLMVPGRTLASSLHVDSHNETLPSEPAPIWRELPPPSTTLPHSHLLTTPTSHQLPSTPPSKHYSKPGQTPKPVKN